jgi:hypothetical protein
MCAAVKSLKDRTALIHGDESVEPTALVGKARMPDRAGFRLESSLTY